MLSNLSPHFTYLEATNSDTARKNNTNNSPGTDELFAMFYTASKMEQVRRILGDKAIRINSWYRSPNLNAAVGGSKTSQHMKGEAVDFTCPSAGTPVDICKKLISSGLSFDQLIYEHSWVHISFKNPDGLNRKQVLTLVNGKYVSGITDKQGKEL